MFSRREGKMKFGKKLQHQLDHSLPDWKPNFLCYKLLKKRLKQLGESPPMTFLTAAIMDGTHRSEDGNSFLIPVTLDELHSEREVVQKRKTEDVFLYGQHKRRKGEDFPQVEDASGSGGEEQGRSSRSRLTENDENFLRLVKTELRKFNAFFLEKEEDFLIRLSLLEEKANDLKEKRARNGGACDRSTHEEMIDVQRQIVTLHGEMVLLMNYSSLNYVGLLKILKKYDKHTKSRLRQLVHASVLRQPFSSIATLKEMVARGEDSLRSIAA